MTENQIFIIYMNMAQQTSLENNFTQMQGFPNLYGYIGKRGSRIVIKGYSSIEDENLDQFYFFSGDVSETDLHHTVEVYFNFILKMKILYLIIPFVKSICKFVKKPDQSLIEKIIDLKGEDLFCDSNFYFAIQNEIIDEFVKSNYQLDSKQKNSFFIKTLHNEKGKENEYNILLRKNKEGSQQIAFFNYFTEGIIYSDHGKKINACISLDHITQDNYCNLIQLYIYSPQLFTLPKKQPQMVMALSKDESRDYYLYSILCKLNVESLSYIKQNEFYTQVISRMPIQQILSLSEKNKNDNSFTFYIEQYFHILQNYIQRDGNFIVYTNNYEGKSITIKEYFSQSSDKRTNSIVKMTQQEANETKWGEFLVNPSRNLIIYIIGDKEKVSLFLPFKQLYLPQDSIEFAKLFHFDTNNKTIQIKIHDTFYKQIIDDQCFLQWKEQLEKNVAFREFIQVYLNNKEKAVIDVIEKEDGYDGLYDKVIKCYQDTLSQLLKYFEHYNIKDIHHHKWKDLSTDLLLNNISIKSKLPNIIESKQSNDYLQIQYDFLSNEINEEVISIFHSFESNVIQCEDQEDYKKEVDELKRAFDKLKMPEIIKNMTIDEVKELIYNYVLNINKKDKQLINTIFEIQNQEIKNLELNQSIYNYLWFTTKKEVFTLLINMSLYSANYTFGQISKISYLSKQKHDSIVNKTFYILNQLLIENSINQIKSNQSKKNWLQLMFLNNEASKLQNKAWMFTEILLYLKYLLVWQKYSKDPTIVDTIHEKQSKFDLFNYLDQLNNKEIVLDLFLEYYKTNSEEEKREIVVKQILANYNYLKYSGKFFELTMKRVFEYNLEEETSFFPEEIDFFMIDLIEVALKDSDDIKIRECLEQIMLYFFDCFFLNYLQYKSRSENVENEKAIKFFGEALDELEKYETHKEDKYIYIKKLYCISYCKMFLFNFTLVLKDLDNIKNDNYDKYEKFREINSILKQPDSQIREMMKYYILKTLRKHQQSFAEFQSFSFISKQMIFVQAYIFKETHPSNFDYIFYSNLYEAEYDTLHSNIKSLRKLIFRTSLYEKEIQTVIIENVDVFLDVTFNSILSNLYQNEYWKKQEYSEFSSWVENLINTLPDENTKLKEMLKNIYFQKFLTQYIKYNEVKLEELEILFIAFKFTVCLMNNDNLWTSLNQEAKKKVEKEKIRWYEEIKDYYYSNTVETVDTYVIRKGNDWEVINLLSDKYKIDYAVLIDKQHQQSIEQTYKIKLNDPKLINQIPKPLFALNDIDIMKQRYTPLYDNDNQLICDDLQTKFVNFILYSFYIFTVNTVEKYNDFTSLISLWKAFTTSLHSYSIDEPKIFFNYIYDSFKGEINKVVEMNNLIVSLNQFIKMKIDSYKTNKIATMELINNKMQFDPYSKKMIFQELYKDYDKYEDVYTQKDYPFWKLFHFVDYPNMKDFQEKVKQVYNYRLKYPFITLYSQDNEFCLKNLIDEIEMSNYPFYLDKKRIIGMSHYDITLFYDGFYNGIEEIIKVFSYRDIFGKDGIDYGNSSSIVYQFDLIEKELATFTHFK